MVPRLYLADTKQTTTSSGPVVGLWLFVAILLSNPLSITSTIVVPAYNRSYSSMPALFGGTWSKPVLAHLQYIPHHPLLCGDDPTPQTAANNTVLKDGVHNDSTVLKSGNTTNLTVDDPSTTLMGDTFSISIPTQDDLPVVLLVQRGKCTFYTKARMASMVSPLVQYVIVYDNQISPQLVPMSSEYPTDMSLLFVSYQTGIQLKYMIMDHLGVANLSSWNAINNNGTIQSPLLSNDTSDTSNDNSNSHDIDDLFQREQEQLLLDALRKNSDGGLIVEMDGVAPLPPPLVPELNPTGFMLMTMTAFFVFMICFACALICAQAGWISAQRDERGRIFLFFAPGSNNTIGSTSTASTARIAALRLYANGLLTKAQVYLLPEQEFSATADDACSPSETSSCLSPTTTIFQEKEEETRPPQVSSRSSSFGSTSCYSNCASCAICLDDFVCGERVRVLPCHHRFHGECVIPWLTERHSSCPLCKFDVLEYIIAHGIDVDDKNENSKVSSSSSPSQHRQRREQRRQTRQDESRRDSATQTETESETRIVASTLYSPSIFRRLLRSFGEWSLLSDQDCDEMESGGIEETTIPNHAVQAVTSTSSEGRGETLTSAHSRDTNGSAEENQQLSLSLPSPEARNNSLFVDIQSPTTDP